tara:strand:- start:32679 stop:32936 length:258 start_codon:yes stop_codon:yes gene_type:complete
MRKKKQEDQKQRSKGEILKKKVEEENKEKTEKKVESKYSHVISKGKALTTKRGILGEGQGICSKDLAGGDEAIAAFVKSKHVEKA